MGNEEFINKCKEIVRQYTEEHLDKSDNMPVFDVFVVWSCKTLQNNKALLSTSLSDGMYYELTYNGDKKNYTLMLIRNLKTDVLKWRKSKMARYQKLPVEIEAELVSGLLEKFKHNFNELPKWVIEAYENTTINTITDNNFIIKTLEGNMIATKEDYLIKGVNGELYPCKKDIFEKTYVTV